MSVEQSSDQLAEKSGLPGDQYRVTDVPHAFVPWSIMSAVRHSLMTMRFRRVWRLRHIRAASRFELIRPSVQFFVRLGITDIHARSSNVPLFHSAVVVAVGVLNALTTRKPLLP